MRYVGKEVTQRRLRRQHTTLISFDEAEPMLETLDYTIRIGSAPTFLYYKGV